MAWAAAVGGALMQAHGAYLGAQANKIKRKKIESIADTPGLDIGQITGEALGNQERYLSQATNLVGREATSQQALVNQLREQSLPGFMALRDKGIAIADDYLTKPFNEQDLRQARYASAVGALGGGYGGSGAQSNAMGVRLYDNAQTRKGLGLQIMSLLSGMFPSVAPQRALGLSGPGAGDLANIRGQERQQRMNLLLQAAGIGGMTQAGANYLTSQGANLQSMGQMGMGSMGGGSGNWSARGGTIGPGASGAGDNWGNWT